MRVGVWKLERSRKRAKTKLEVGVEFFVEIDARGIGSYISGRSITINTGKEFPAL